MYCPTGTTRNEGDGGCALRDGERRGRWKCIASDSLHVPVASGSLQRVKSMAYRLPTVIDGYSRRSPPSASVRLKQDANASDVPLNVELAGRPEWRVPRANGGNVVIIGRLARFSLSLSDWKGRVFDRSSSRAARCPFSWQGAPSTRQPSRDLCSNASDLIGARRAT